MWTFSIFISSISRIINAFTNNTLFSVSILLILTTLPSLLLFVYGDWKNWSTLIMAKVYNSNSNNIYLFFSKLLVFCKFAKEVMNSIK